MSTYISYANSLTNTWQSNLKKISIITFGALMLYQIKAILLNYTKVKNAF